MKGARVGRGVTVGVILSLLACLPQRAIAQEEERQRDAKWVSEHLDLNLLPVAYVVRRGQLSVGGSMSLTPVGFPATTYSLYPNPIYGVAKNTEVTLGVTGAERPGPGGEATFY